MTNYVYILREEEQLDLQNKEVFLEAYLTEAAAEAALVKQVQRKATEPGVTIEEMEEGYAELSNEEENNYWVFRVEAVPVLEK